MIKYLNLLKYEFKTILRDPVNLYMCIFPLIILALSSYVFPVILKSVESGQETAQKITMLLLLFIVLAFSGFLLAAMATFLLLEHKDESTLHTIAVTPVQASGYIRFKMAYLYFMSVISGIVVLWGTKVIAGQEYSLGGVSLFDHLSPAFILCYALVSSLFPPALALFQGAFARNKVEGFAFIKGTGILAMVPALMILDAFQGGMQYVLGIFPNFWAIKGTLLQLLPNSDSANLSTATYFLIGVAYNLFILFAAYRLFLRKAQY